MIAALMVLGVVLLLMLAKGIAARVLRRRRELRRERQLLLDRGIRFDELRGSLMRDIGYELQMLPRRLANKWNSARWRYYKARAMVFLLYSPPLEDSRRPLQHLLQMAVDMTPEQLTEVIAYAERVRLEAAERALHAFARGEHVIDWPVKRAAPPTP